MFCTGDQRQARGGRIDEEQRDAFGRPRRHQQHVGDVAPGDVALHAGELPAGRRLLGARRDRRPGSSRDRRRARSTVGARVAGGDGRQPALLLRVGAGLGDGGGDQHRRPVGAGIGGAPELLEQQRGLDHAEAAAAVLLRAATGPASRAGPSPSTSPSLSPRGSSHSRRTAADLQCSSRNARAEFFSSVWSGVKEKSMAQAFRRSARTSLGRPSTRSPMMFFWISDEPE